MPHLTDTDRQALQLAADLQKAVEQWLGYRGVNQSCTVSPFVDGAGQPAVLMKMNAQAAQAMIDSLQPQHASVQPGPGGAPAGPSRP